MWDLLHRKDCYKNERYYHFWWYNVEAVKFKDLPDDWVCPLCGLENKINSLNISNSKELQGFVSRIIYVWFYILSLLLFAQNFDNIKQM